MFAALESSTDVLDYDSTDAFQVLSEMCTFIRCSVSLPERIHICAAGQCDWAHPEVHQNFNSHVQTQPFAEEMHGSCHDSAYFAFIYPTHVREFEYRQQRHSNVKDLNFLCNGCIFCVPSKTKSNGFLFP